MRKSRHWLVLTSRISWNHMQSMGEWAFAEKSLPRAKSIRPGDDAVVYLRVESDVGPAAIGGSIRFTGRVARIDREGIFDQMYPLRIPIAVEHRCEPPIPYISFVEALSFIKNKSNWGGYLQGQAAKELNDDDFLTLHSAIRSISEP